MKFTNKVNLAALIAAAQIAGAVSASAQIPHDVQGTRFETPIQVLAALKIMIGDHNGDFRPDDTIIRSEVTKMAVHLMGLEELAGTMNGESRFPDVSADHWANGYINAGTSLGLIIGDDNGNFRPNDEITYAEAMTIVLRALGYDHHANSSGGYPTGYLNVGAQNGLSKNVTGYSGDPISRGNVAYMVYNSLTVNTMEKIGSSYEVTKKTLLTDALKVTKGTGQVTAVDCTSIDGSSEMKTNQLKINGTVYDAAYNMNTLLGFNVDYYVQQNGDGSETLILALPSENKNNVLRVSAENIDDVALKNNVMTLTYSESGSASKTAKIASDAIVLYNGKQVPLAQAIINISDSEGRLTLLDTNTDGTYNIINVIEYETLVVNSASASGNITFKNSANPIRLDDKVNYRITRGLEEITPAELNENDVLSVSKSKDGKIIDIIVSCQSVSGRITAMDDDYISIDGEKYKRSNHLYGSIKTGDFGTYLLDFENKVVAQSSSSVSTTSGYAYLLNAYENTDDTGTYCFKIFTADGTELIVTANDKITYNGTAGVPAKNVIAEIEPYQLITFEVNAKGKLTALKTARDNTATGAVDTNNFVLNYSLTDAVYKSATGKLGSVGINSDTKVFAVDNENTKFRIETPDIFKNNHTYTALVYDVTENLTAKVVVVTDSVYSPEATAPLAVVKSISTKLNSLNENADSAVLYVNGEQTELFAADTTVLTDRDGKKLSAGDVIQYEVNSDNEIAGIRVIFTMNERNSEFTAAPAADLEIVYGKVTKAFANSINVSVDGGSAVNYVIPENAGIYKIDSSLKYALTKASFGDISEYNETDNNRVLIKIYDHAVTELIIIE